jgi:hypothetical protein
MEMQQTLSQAARKEEALRQERGPPPPPSPNKADKGPPAQDTFGDFGSAQAAPAGGEFGEFETAGGEAATLAHPAVQTESDPFAGMQEQTLPPPVPDLTMGSTAAPNDAQEVAVEIPLAELPGKLMASDWLEEAVQCEEHAQASKTLAEEKQRLQQAVAEENFEACVGIKKQIAELGPKVQADDVVQEWQQKAQGRFAGEHKSTADLLAEIRATGDEQAASTFTARYTQPLAETGPEALAVALQRYRSAKRSHWLFMALRTTHNNYTGYWEQVLGKCSQEAERAISLFAKIDALEGGDQARQQVLQQEKVRTYISGVFATKAVCNRIRVSAAVAMVDAKLGTAQKLDELWGQLDAAFSKHGIQEAVEQLSLTVAELEAKCAEMPLDAALCTLSLLPLPADQRSPEIIHFCGAPYYTPCANLWVNYVSNSPPVSMPMAACS